MKRPKTEAIWAIVKKFLDVELFITGTYFKRLNFIMSISPISASSLYQEQINYFLNATKTDYSSVSNLLAVYGVKSTGDNEKDIAKLMEIQTETAANLIQGLSEDDETSKSTQQPVSYSWYSVMYQLGLNPTGDPKQDFIEIMECLVDKAEKATSESEYNKYMDLIGYVEDIFIDSGVKISDITADSVSTYKSMEILANYNKADIESS